MKRPKDRFLRSYTSRELRRRMYRDQQGLCHWCDRHMTIGLTYQQVPLEERSAIATLDHLYPEGDLRRHLKKGKNAVVLACYGCNQRLNVVFQCLQRNDTYAVLYPPVDIRTFLTDNSTT